MIKKNILFMDPYPFIKHKCNIPELIINLHTGLAYEETTLLVEGKRKKAFFIKNHKDRRMHIVPEFRIFQNRKDVEDYIKNYYDKCIEIATKRYTRNHEYMIHKPYFKGIGSSSLTLINNLINKREEIYDIIRKSCGAVYFNLMKEEQHTIFEMYNT